MRSPSDVRARLRPWVADLLRSATQGRRVGSASSDPLSTFASEATPANANRLAATASIGRRPSADQIIAAALGAFVALAAVGAIGLVQKRSVSVDAAERKPAKLTVDRRPTGAEVVINGPRRGE